MKTLFALLALVALASATTLFEEQFTSDPFNSGWVVSDWKQKEGSAGKWDWSAGPFYGDADADKGLHTAEDYRFYTISKEFTDFSSKGKTLVLQYSVKNPQNIDCGGGYIKVLPAGLDQPNFNGDSKYNIMFGPDICGSSTRRVHVIFSHDGTNHLIKKTINAETDVFTHVYTLIVRPDNTYEVRIDNKEVAKGSLEEDWDMLPPKQILDPNASEPADWEDRKELVDPEDKKPEGYDEIAREIADPDAKKPDDWDDELDGEWEAPVIPNPEFKGEWKPRMIPNPAYKGEWVHPKIDNPAYKTDANLYAYDSNSFVGFELWQVKSGTVFDNILLTDSVEEAEEAAKHIEETTRKGEKEMHTKQEEAKRAKEEEERKQRENEEAAKKAVEESDEDHAEAVHEQAEADKKDEL